MYFDDATPRFFPHPMRTPSYPGPNESQRVTVHPMIKTGLEFAPGTTEDCKKLVGQLFTPSEILSSYRTARHIFKTGDIVLVSAQFDPSGFNAMPRRQYVKTIHRGMEMKGATMLSSLVIAHKSAHQVAQLPSGSDAMWLVIARKSQVPIMAVIYATPYDVGVDSHQSDLLVS